MSYLMGMLLAFNDILSISPKSCLGLGFDFLAEHSVSIKNSVLTLVSLTDKQLKEHAYRRWNYLINFKPLLLN